MAVAISPVLGFFSKNTFKKGLCCDSNITLNDDIFEGTNIDLEYAGYFSSKYELAARQQTT